eukprot:CAMPEP_0114391758 /NCGR_PEP_ID=MMETSP0102-20121206/10329_1 /TAXON_ID=38822 ORGANISM="Pteridomonas danica, Strain PT" /NCGR_SAMPLE_ID=MMETSP0102 /ASSEMBLY_ACC=CAM_ASM_000212 /LENGTH=214 /DNA_ID=CAMNT_0001550679 /DNA_START=96 /DNA_END=741 /DNA_ORIENTATION=+
MFSMKLIAEEEKQKKDMLLIKTDQSSFFFQKCRPPITSHHNNSLSSSIDQNINKSMGVKLGNASSSGSKLTPLGVGIKMLSRDSDDSGSDDELMNKYCDVNSQSSEEQAQNDQEEEKDEDDDESVDPITEMIDGKAAISFNKMRKAVSILCKRHPMRDHEGNRPLTASDDYAARFIQKKFMIYLSNKRNKENEKQAQQKSFRMPSMKNNKSQRK